MEILKIIKTIQPKVLLLFIIIITGLYTTSLYSYLLFHSLAELFAVLIAFSFFIIAWNTKENSDNSYLIYAGILYLFIGFLDILHILTYKGMNIFPSQHYFANQFWIAGRYLESLTLLTGFLIIRTRLKLKPDLLFAIGGLITFLIVLSILHWKVFPICYAEGIGQTQFKIISEYIIIFILASSIYFLYKNKDYFDTNVYYLILFSILSTAASEFCFTLYIGNYDLSNQIGHHLKLFSYYFIYKANIETSIRKPTEIVYRNLKLKEEELKELNATKDRFFSIIAHDLRNPFSALINLSEILYKKSETLSKEDIIHYSSLLYDSSQKSYKLLENLLLWSKAKMNKIKFEPDEFTINDVINENLWYTKEIAHRKNIQVQFDTIESIQVHADSNMINTVVRNLLMNSIKFTRSEGKIIISLNKDESHVTVNILDNGIGISESELSKLFRIDMKQSQIGTNGEEGTGLGLILCKEFVEKNNGQIQVKSKLNQYTEFSFTVPLNKG